MAKEYRRLRQAGWWVGLGPSAVNDAVAAEVAAAVQAPCPSCGHVGLAILPMQAPEGRLGTLYLCPACGRDHWPQ
jgi:predicted RNA-binding Zn-ribbon protein involved in translation (DUF1610 family)